MRKVLVYDSPTRLFHWLFAGFFVTAFAIANLVDDESARFTWHMLAGLGLLTVVVLRLAWSLVGTRHARLGDLRLNPAQLLAYFRGMFSGEGKRWVGHNPASSWAAVTMVALALGLGTTGLLMASGSGSDSLEEVHELMANAFLVVALLHIAGVVVHVLRHRDGLPAAMVTGRKEVADAQEADVRPVALAGFAFLLLTGLSMAYVLNGYDAQARTLQLFGSTLQLGEDEGGEAGEGRGEDEDHEREHGSEALAGRDD